MSVELFAGTAIYAESGGWAGFGVIDLDTAAFHVLKGSGPTISGPEWLLVGRGGSGGNLTNQGGGGGGSGAILAQTFGVSGATTPTGSTIEVDMSASTPGMIMSLGPTTATLLAPKGGTGGNASGGAAYPGGVGVAPTASGLWVPSTTIASGGGGGGSAVGQGGAAAVGGFKGGNSTSDWRAGGGGGASSAGQNNNSGLLTGGDGGAGVDWTTFLSAAGLKNVIGQFAVDDPSGPWVDMLSGLIGGGGGGGSNLGAGGNGIDGGGDGGSNVAAGQMGQRVGGGGGGAGATSVGTSYQGGPAVFAFAWPIA